MLCGMVLNVMMTTIPNMLVSIPVLTVQYVILSTNCLASAPRYARAVVGTHIIGATPHDVADD